MMLNRIFPSRTLALYTARMFVMRTFAFLAGLALILMTLDLLGESARILAVPGNGEAELWKYVSIRMPQIIALFLPFSVLLPETNIDTSPRSVNLTEFPMRLIRIWETAVASPRMLLGMSSSIW